MSGVAARRSKDKEPTGVPWPNPRSYLISEKCSWQGIGKPTTAGSRPQKDDYMRCPVFGAVHQGSPLSLVHCGLMVIGMLMLYEFRPKQC